MGDLMVSREAEQLVRKQEASPAAAGMWWSIVLMENDDAHVSVTDMERISVIIERRLTEKFDDGAHRYDSYSFVVTTRGHKPDPFLLSVMQEAHALIHEWPSATMWVNTREIHVRYGSIPMTTIWRDR
jgi:hypothetical protein